MPDHLVALQHIRARDFRFGERSSRTQMAQTLRLL